MRQQIAAATLMEYLVRNTYTDKRSSAVQPLQWSIMRYLASSKSQSREMSAVVAYVGLTRAPVSRAVSTLEQRGLVQKKCHPDSARSIIVRLTKAGRNVLSDDPILQVAQRIGELSKDDQRQFSRTLRDLSLGALSEELEHDEDNTSD